MYDQAIGGIPCPFECYSKFSHEMFKFILSSLHPDKVDCVFVIENEYAVIFFEEYWMSVSVRSHKAFSVVTASSRLVVSAYDYRANSYELTLLRERVPHDTKWACVRVSAEKRQSKMLAFMMSTVDRLRMNEADDGKTCICHILDVFLLGQIARTSSLNDDVPAYCLSDDEMIDFYRTFSANR
jgi:hypothetical protein